MKIIKIKRALLSVSDKTNIVDLAKELINFEVEIISTGGTSQLLAKANVRHKQVEEITGLAEMLDGRVKTLHPKIHGGILGKRDIHAKEVESAQIDWIDLVVVNFYPFDTGTKIANLSLEEAVEYIDIGGPTMARAAAKNMAWVGVVVSPLDYPTVIDEIKKNQGLTFETRSLLAAKVFALTSYYDQLIYTFLAGIKTNLPHLEAEALHLHFKKVTSLRYGENPHQKACAYQQMDAQGGTQQGILSAIQLQGKPLSYNNIIDAEAARACLSEFSEPTCVIIKHTSPCGVASAETIFSAYQLAKMADSQSAFGGIVAINRICDQDTAEAVMQIFTEVMLAPSYTPEALALFASKPNLRLLILPDGALSALEMKYLSDGLLLQERDTQSLTIDDLKIVTNIKPDQKACQAMLFAWRVLKHIKSNGILIAKNQMTVGIGAGQVSRIDAVEMALYKSSTEVRGSILASDAFFPFRDSIDRIAKTGILAVVQPGGSVRDDEVIAACNEHGMAMAFTGRRCFKH